MDIMNKQMLQIKCVMGFRALTLAYYCNIQRTVSLRYNDLYVVEEK